jgi:hypothetical protein
LLSLFPLAESLALAADVISEKGTYDEVMFWRKTCKRLIYYYADSVKALLSSEEDVDIGVAHSLDDVFYVLTLKAIDCKVLITGITGEENHLSHTLLVFINMIHQHLHIESLLNCFELFC